MPEPASIHSRLTVLSAEYHRDLFCHTAEYPPLPSSPLLFPPDGFLKSSQSVTLIGTALPESWARAIEVPSLYTTHPNRFLSRTSQNVQTYRGQSAGTHPPCLEAQTLEPFNCDQTGSQRPRSGGQAGDLSAHLYSTAPSSSTFQQQ